MKSKPRIGDKVKIKYKDCPYYNLTGILIKTNPAWHEIELTKPLHNQPKSIVFAESSSFIKIGLNYNE